jgi:hypothetical protein
MPTSTICKDRTRGPEEAIRVNPDVRAPHMIATFSPNLILLFCRECAVVETFERVQTSFIVIPSDTP